MKPSVVGWEQNEPPVLPRLDGEGAGGWGGGPEEPKDAERAHTRLAQQQ